VGKAAGSVCWFSSLDQVVSQFNIKGYHCFEIMILLRQCGSFVGTHERPQAKLGETYVCEFLFHDYHGQA
jgi:hypothetical protein